MKCWRCQRLTRLLEATGRVTIAGSSIDPEQALAFLRAHEVDLLFLDIQMPGLTGFQLLERLERDVAVDLHHRVRPLRAGRVHGELDRLPAQADRTRTTGAGARQDGAAGPGSRRGTSRALARPAGRGSCRRRESSSASPRASASGRRFWTSRASATSSSKDKLTFAVRRQPRARRSTFTLNPARGAARPAPVRPDSPRDDRQPSPLSRSCSRPWTAASSSVSKAIRRRN